MRLAPHFGGDISFNGMAAAYRASLRWRRQLRVTASAHRYALLASGGWHEGVRHLILKSCTVSGGGGGTAAAASLSCAA
jgi:hypothetical protein